MKLIYIASPYTKGDVVINVRRQIDTGDRILGMGHIPYVPNLTHFWHFVSPKAYEIWMDIDSEILKRCDAVLRLSGESKGADREVELAKSLGIPVYYSLEDIT